MSNAGRCPLCDSQSDKVLYLGFPMRLCRKEECSCVFGFWSRIAAWFPIVVETEDGPSFAFFGYTGSYWLALWHWLRGVE